MKVFCGIDWAEDHHDVALIDADGGLVAKRRIGDSAMGFAELMTMLADAGDIAEAPIPVAIETPRGLLVSPCARPAAASTPSTRWPSPAIASATPSPARSPTTSTP